MVTTHTLGFPRIGADRELKFGLENFWNGQLSENELLDIAAKLREAHWKQQSVLDFAAVGDFSLYDHVLDMSFTLGNQPDRVHHGNGSELDRYFQIARGQSGRNSEKISVRAAEMTKWFDSNYHYIVPEFDATTTFSLNPDRLYHQITQAQRLGVKAKPVIIGPVTYLWLGKSTDASNKLDLLERILPVYNELLNGFNRRGIEWVQIDEPILVTELGPEWRHALSQSYHCLNSSRINILLATYFGELQENLPLVCELPVQGIHLDAVRGRDEVIKLIDWSPAHRIISLGVVDGRNVWKTDLNATLDLLEPVHVRLKARLWIAPSCSLLHVPADLENEKALHNIHPWLAFARQKLEELDILSAALNYGRDRVAHRLENNATAIDDRKSSEQIHNVAVKRRVSEVTHAMSQRQSPYVERHARQADRLKLPLFPTTTIGSFPQTLEIRQTRSQFKNGELESADYRKQMQREIDGCIREQDALGLDVLVHGEPERNDMVEYFGEQLDGIACSQSGWVQSYGSRCVKPPIIFGDISRPKPMTCDWIDYARSLTRKPLKGMLTGPVTLLNWSFVRNDQSRADTCLQLALAIRDEVLDLEKAGINLIQIDEAALREGMPLRKSEWQNYLNRAVDAFRIAANGVQDTTQIHTHMCYSEFNDIIKSIAAMDADVITLETSRSNMALLDVFDDFNYPNQIGPGVYDIHSPNIPSVESIIALMQYAATKIPAHRLWVNPDCGLKTRAWDEVKPALRNMVAAAEILRARQAAAKIAAPRTA